MPKSANALTIVSPNPGQPVPVGTVTFKGKYVGRRPVYLSGAVFQGDTVPNIVDSTRGKILPNKAWQIRIPVPEAGAYFVVVWAVYREEDPVDRISFFFVSKTKHKGKTSFLGPNLISVIDPTGNVNVMGHMVNADGSWSGTQPLSIVGEIWDMSKGPPPSSPPPMGTTAGTVIPGVSFGGWTMANIPNVQCSQTGVMNPLVVWATYTVAPPPPPSMAGTGFLGFCPP